jgi:hypothetical protein
VQGTTPTNAVTGAPRAMRSAAKAERITIVVGREGAVERVVVT